MDNDPSFLTGASFVTGSRAYGAPRPESDVDLVIRINRRDLAILSAMADKVAEYPENKSASLRFGKLNLICTTSDDAFLVWNQGTIELAAKAPVGRAEAIEHFAALGVTPRFDSSPQEIDFSPIRSDESDIDF